jgi:hypothetical protein
MDGVVVGCGQCGNYRITGVAFHEFARMQQERRQAALQAAKAMSQSGWPMIGTSAVRPAARPSAR